MAPTKVFRFSDLRIFKLFQYSTFAESVEIRSSGDLSEIISTSVVKWLLPSQEVESFTLLAASDWKLCIFKDVVE